LQLHDQALWRTRDDAIQSFSEDSSVVFSWQFNFTENYQRLSNFNYIVRYQLTSILAAQLSSPSNQLETIHREILTCGAPPPERKSTESNYRVCSRLLSAKSALEVRMRAHETTRSWLFFRRKRTSPKCWFWLCPFRYALFVNGGLQSKHDIWK
jgi:hypothetical protein